MTTYELAACPVCNTNDFREVASADEIRAQLERLWEFHMRRLEPGAPVQQLFDRAVFSQAPPMHVVSCTQCGTVLRNPRESADSVVELYAREEPPAEALEALFRQQQRFYRPRVRRLTRLHGGAGSVLEIGSYVGGFLTAATAAGWRAHGMDVNAGANAFARRKGCAVREGAIEDAAEEAAYDVVALWNCFDQLPDPRGALMNARRLLQPHGLLTLRVPNGACYSTLGSRKRFQPLLAHNNLLGFPYRHGFTPAALARLLGDAGFEIVIRKADTLVSTAGPWTRKWADVEARAMKRIMRALLPRRLAPWLEIYARAV